jgi:formyltetrahydrofolate deformylase
MSHSETAVLLLSCPDQKGIVSEISQFIFKNGGNIVRSDQHTDFEDRTFFMRIEWELSGFRAGKEEIQEIFRPVAAKFGMEWRLDFSSSVKKIAVLVSKLDHCLYEVLLRKRSGEFRADIPLIISNHDDLRPVADYFGIDFHHVPVAPDNKGAAENTALELLEQYRVDTIVLARYMQVLGGGFIARYPNRIINIHHSFLPAFTGGKPYHQAYDRGVKLIGATSHYVTAELDNGPIIEQDVIRISHRDSLDDLVRKGRELERSVLASAVKRHLENKTLVFRNKTLVFD